MGEAILTRRPESSPRGVLPASRNSHEERARSIEGTQGKTFEALIWMTREPNGSEAVSSIVELREVQPIEIDGEDEIQSVVFLAVGHHILGGEKQNIRRWRVEEMNEVGTPMDAGSHVMSVAISQDGNLIVSGTWGGQVTVWDAENHQKAIEFRRHRGWVNAVDVSPDATKFATGSSDCTVRVWSFSSGELLLGPLEHDYEVAAVKFSPDGSLIATATWDRQSLRIYDSKDSHLHHGFPIEVSSYRNQSLAWLSESRQLFALSCDGIIFCLDVFTGQILSQWTFYHWDVRELDDYPTCICLAGNDTFIAASRNSSVSFWDITRRKQIGPVIYHTATTICSMAISPNYDLVIGGGKKITLWHLPDILPRPYSDNVGAFASST